MSLEQWIYESNNIVFFGGAGVSTESNIPDFRSSSGLFSYMPEEILSFTFFKNNPSTFFKFYKENLIYLDAQPNDAHLALARLEQQGKLKALITQNIDGLHQKANSKNVIELHGNIYRNYCIKCFQEYQIEDVLKQDIPKCNCGGIVRPDIVLYEEVLNDKVVNLAITAIKNCELLIIAGTSLSVYPAANFIRYFQGKHIVIINKEKTDYDSRCDLVIHDSVSRVLKSIIK